jgi:hypothetical protein
MFTRFSKSSIVNQQPKLNSALVGNPGGSIGVTSGVSSYTAIMQYIKIPALSNAFYFGSCLNNHSASGKGCAASNTRGVMMGGQMSGAPYTAWNYIDYITFATTGDSSVFGTLSATKTTAGSVSSSTRGVIAGGDGNNTASIEYITIATTGNASYFGSLGIAWSYMCGGSNSSTRGAFGGGFRSGATTRIDYVTIATTGDSANFGSLTTTRYLIGASGSNTRGIFGGGGYNPGVIDYITIASTGNATSFGTLSDTLDATGAPVSDNIKVCWIGSNVETYQFKTMQYITIASTGNSVRFSTDALSQQASAAMSNNHGGLN